SLHAHTVLSRSGSCQIAAGRWVLSCCLGVRWLDTALDAWIGGERGDAAPNPRSQTPKAVSSHRTPKNGKRSWVLSPLDGRRKTAACRADAGQPDRQAMRLWRAVKRSASRAGRGGRDTHVVQPDDLVR